MANPPTSDDNPRKTATDTAQVNKSNFENIAPIVRTAVTDQNESAKKTTARSVGGIASAHDRVAAELRADSPPFEQSSTNLLDVSYKHRSKKYFKLFPIIESFVRRHPVVSVGGAIILGFAASRLAKTADHHDNKTLQSPDTILRHSPYNTPHAGTYRTPLWILQTNQETR